jgi:threonine dehydratase
MTRSVTRLGPADVVRAAERIGDRIRRTPLLGLTTLPGLLIKAEHRQRSGSFKARGAANAMLSLGTGPTVTGSSGNHGIAVATLGRLLGVEVTVVMAAAAVEAKAAAIRRLGGQVIRVEGGVADRERYVRDYADRTGALFVPSSDHELVVAGQGTVGLEIFDQLPEVAEVFVPTGGGGLLAGICLAAEGLRRPVRIIGVEPVAGQRYAHSLRAGGPVQLPPPDTIADGLRAQCPGEVPFPIIRQRVDDLVGVTDEAILHAMDLLRAEGVAAEPSGAVAVAGALEFGFRRTSVAVVSGGNTAEVLAAPAVRNRSAELS